VPQGSVLGLLLFLLYINDISRVLPGENVKLFADDTNLFISGIDICALCNVALRLLGLLTLDLLAMGFLRFPRCALRV